ncbi:MAG TPA: hypothetical protein VEA78_01575 [Acidimicrobiales bacterium]|nr:hypothetical protein [Acidimicrobiales bacterium]
MAAPEYVPNNLAQQPRRGLALPPARKWAADRPGELGARQPRDAALGDPGPDQGYALLLARRFSDRLVVEAGESAEDAIKGCLGVALKRASLFGRAPTIHDLEIAFRIWGFLGSAPAELVALRKPLFTSVANAHHYKEQRAIADLVPEATLRLLHTDVAARFPGEWSALLGR